MAQGSISIHKRQLFSHYQGVESRSFLNGFATFFHHDFTKPEEAINAHFTS